MPTNPTSGGGRGRPQAPGGYGYPPYQGRVERALSVEATDPYGLHPAPPPRMPSRNSAYGPPPGPAYVGPKGQMYPQAAPRFPREPSPHLSTQMGLQPQEQACFDRLFTHIDQRKTGFLSGQVVFPVFITSKLPKDKLSKIWNVANSDKNTGLIREDFYVAMRLIAVAQRGYAISAESVKKIRDLPIPVFDDTVSSILIPEEIEVPDDRPQGLSEEEEAQWIMTSQEREDYKKYFKNADQDDDNWVSGKEARIFFKQSTLPSSQLFQIWTLSDHDEDGKLDLDEFCVAMHLVRKVKRHHLTLPPALPTCLIPNLEGSPSKGPAAAGAASSGTGSYTSGSGLGTSTGTLDLIWHGTGLETSNRKRKDQSDEQNEPDLVDGKVDDLLDLSAIPISSNPTPPKHKKNESLDLLMQIDQATSVPVDTPIKKDAPNSAQFDADFDNFGFGDSSNSTKPANTDIDDLLSFPTPTEPPPKQSSEIDVLRKELDEAASTQEGLTKTLSETRAEIEVTSSDVNTLKDRVQQYKEDHRKIREQIEKTQEELLEYKEQKRDFETLLKDQESAYGDELDELKELETTLNRFRMSFKQSRGTIKERNVEKEVLEEKRASLLKQQREYKDRTEQAEHDINILTSQIEQLKDQIAEQRELNDNQRMILQTKKSQKRELSRQKKDLRKQLQQEQNELKVLKGRTKTLSEEVASPNSSNQRSPNIPQKAPEIVKSSSEVSGDGLGDEPVFGDEPAFGREPSFDNEPTFDDESSFDNKPAAGFGNKPDAGFANKSAAGFGNEPAGFDNEASFSDDVGFGDAPNFEDFEIPKDSPSAPQPHPQANKKTSSSKHDTGDEEINDSGFVPDDDWAGDFDKSGDFDNSGEFGEQFDFENRREPAADNDKQRRVSDPVSNDDDSNDDHYDRRSDVSEDEVLDQGPGQGQGQGPVQRHDQHHDRDHDQGEDRPSLMSAGPTPGPDLPSDVDDNEFGFGDDGDDGFGFGDANPFETSGGANPFETAALDEMDSAAKDDDLDWGTEPNPFGDETPGFGDIPEPGFDEAEPTSAPSPPSPSDKAAAPNPQAPVVEEKKKKKKKSKKDKKKKKKDKKQKKDRSEPPAASAPAGGSGSVVEGAGPGAGAAGDVETPMQGDGDGNWADDGDVDWNL